MQSLRFISEAAQDMTAKRSLFSGSDTNGKPIPASDIESDADEADFFDMASPDTRSEVSHYHDCQSEGGRNAIAHRSLPAVGEEQVACCCRFEQQQRFASGPIGRRYIYCEAFLLIYCMLWLDVQQPGPLLHQSHASLQHTHPPRMGELVPVARVVACGIAGQSPCISYVSSAHLH